MRIVLNSLSSNIAIFQKTNVPYKFNITFFEKKRFTVINPNNDVLHTRSKNRRGSFKSVRRNEIEVCYAESNFLLTNRKRTEIFL